MDGVVGGSRDLVNGATSIVTAPVDAVATTVGGILSAPAKGAQHFLLGDGAQQLTGDSGQSSVDAALKKTETEMF